MTNARTIAGTFNTLFGRDGGDMGGRGERELRAECDLVAPGTGG